MAGTNIARGILTGNLTRDPELVERDGAKPFARLRVAANTRVKRGDEWVDKANYFDVVVFGAQAPSMKRYLSKGSPVAVDGRLDYSEWETQDGQKRSGVSIIADSVQFLEGRRSDDEPPSDVSADAPAAASPAPTEAAAPEEDDIPF